MKRRVAPDPGRVGDDLRSLQDRLRAPLSRHQAVRGEASPRLKAGLRARNGQALNLERLMNGAPERAPWTVRRGRNSTPVFVRNLAGAEPAPLVAQPRVPAPLQRGAGALAARPDAAALGLLTRHRELFRLEDPEQELQVVSLHVDALGKQHVKLQQVYKSLPLWANEIVVHLDSRGSPYMVNGRYSPTPRDLDVTPVVTAEAAVAVAVADLSRSTEILELDGWARRALAYERPASQLLVWVDRRTSKPHLAWHVNIRPNLRDNWRYFVHARDGGILERYNASNRDGAATGRGKDLRGVDQSVGAYQEGATYFLLDASRPTWAPSQPDPVGDPQGGILTVDADNTQDQLFYVTSSDNTWNDPVSVSAHHHAGLVFDYYLKTHRRNSIDGQSSTILSVIHFPDEDGGRLDNAFWNGQFMLYGDGRTIFRPFAGALDVAGHEFTHGVVQHTVNLEYKFQSGALSESFADVFGCMVDREDWLLGEDIVVRDYFPSGALRDMQDPHNGAPGPEDPNWQPAHMNEYQDLSSDEDHGGVHTNSGIPNRACFLIASAIGREKTEAIYYRVLDARYLNARSNFNDLRESLITAATDLHGGSSPEVAAVKNGLAAVGIGEGTGDTDGGEEPPEDIPAVTGPEWIAVANDETKDTSLFLGLPTIPASGIHQLTPTHVFTGSASPITVTDDGEVLLFVDDENNIRIINFDGSDEEALTENGIWSSISLSPDGTKFAATTTFEDRTIFVYDFLSDRLEPVELHTPTTQDGVVGQTIAFADALDWDQGSRFLLFDALSRIPDGIGDPYEFWAIYTLDSDSVLAGSGPPDISPIFWGFPPGVSIGNPSYAQTNDSVFAFDLVDLRSGAMEVWAADLFLGDAGPFVEGLSSPGFPRYSPDDGHVVFQNITDLSRIYQVPVDASKTMAAGDPVFYAQEGTHPLWFAVGSRPAPTAPAQLLEVDPPSGPVRGGTAVALSGRNFSPGSTQVFFDGQPATLEAENYVLIRATTPAGATGFVEVKISTPAGTVSVPNGYYFEGDPVVASVSPSQGVVFGGQKVTIAGRGLKATASVTIGGRAVSQLTVINDTKVEFTAPVWLERPGAQDLNVQTRFGQTLVVDAFTYVPIPGTFDLLKGSAKRKAPKNGPPVWDLKVSGFFNPGIGAYPASWNGTEVRVVVDGNEYFTCPELVQVKVKRNKKTGDLTSLKLKDIFKRTLSLSWKKKTLKLSLKGIPADRLTLPDGLTLSINLANVKATLTSSTFFTNIKQDKAALAATAGELEPNPQSAACR